MGRAVCVVLGCWAILAAMASPLDGAAQFQAAGVPLATTANATLSPPVDLEKYVAPIIQHEAPEPEPEPDPEREPAVPLPEPEQEQEPEPPMMAPPPPPPPGCSHPPALRVHASWTPENRAAALHCLANKTIYLLGNSVTRHWAFTLADILAEGQASPVKMPPVMYEQQKQKCGRGGRWRGKRPDGGSVLPGADGQCWGLCECSFESVPIWILTSTVAYVCIFHLKSAKHVL